MHLWTWWVMTQTVSRKRDKTPTTIIELQRALNATVAPLPFPPDSNNISRLSNTTAATVHTRTVAFMLSIMVIIQAFVLLFSICLCENDEQGSGEDSSNMCFQILAIVYGFIAMSWAPAASLLDAVVLCLLSVLTLGRLWYPSIQDLRRLIAQWR
jgi:hypothetical protein